MRYVDLQPCDYFGQANPKLLAVGWLEPGHHHAEGPLPDAATLEKLVLLLEKPWQPVVFGGWHDCGWCRLTSGVRSMHVLVGTRTSDDREGMLDGREARLSASTDKQWVSITRRTVSITMGISNLYVPARDVVFVAPSLILHYMDAHGYTPPVEFLAAVRECPRMASPAYLEAIFDTCPEWRDDG